MAFKNTVRVTDINKTIYTLHFVNREFDIECQIYPLGNARKAETIGIFDKQNLIFTKIGRDYEYPRAKYICNVLLQHAFNIKTAFVTMFYRKLKIVPLGKMEINVKEN